MSPDELRDLVLPRRTLDRLGSDPRTTRTPKSWMRLQRDCYVDAARWAGLSPRDQHLLRASTVDDQAAAPPLLSHQTAAAIWDLPLIGAWPTQVQSLVADNGSGHRPGLNRHRTTRMPKPVRYQGFSITAPARTVIDIARSSVESGLSAADRALRRQLCTAADLAAEAEAIPVRGRGRRSARTVAALADAGAESTGESLSRLRLWQLGFPKPALQVRFADAEGEMFTDFGWEEQSLIGEFDGFVKYKVPDGASAKEAATVLWKEKRREDRVRRLGPGVARWVWADCHGPQRLREILLGHGLRPGAADWF